MAVEVIGVQMLNARTASLTFGHVCQVAAEFMLRHRLNLGFVWRECDLVSEQKLGIWSYTKVEATSSREVTGLAAVE